MSRPLIIISVIALYFLALLIVAHFSGKGANNTTYFTGNRNMAWPVVALAMITAPISGITYISVPGMVTAKSFGYLQMCMGFVVGYFLIGWVLVPLFYKHKIISIYSFLQHRFGKTAYKTGAWLFLVSEILGVGVRFLVVCIVLQMLVFGPLHLPFALNVTTTMGLIWLYTAKGGVKTVIWSDTLKSLCLVTSLVLFFFFISGKLGIPMTDLPQHIIDHPSARIFFFDDLKDSSYFWKQFVTGIFLVVAMTGLDQDMMQRILACKDSKGSRKNLAVSGLMQFVVIALFLCLGILMAIYMERYAIEPPQHTDDIFATVAFHEEMPAIVGILFVLGLVSASYSSVGSALTSLTTSFTIDIMEGNRRYDEHTLKIRRNMVHAGMAFIMGLVILGVYYLNHQDAITALFTIASYTYGPILGLFIFGIFTKKMVNTKFVAIVCVLAPILSWIISFLLKKYFDYSTGFEVFLINTLITLAGISMAPKEKREESHEKHPIKLSAEEK